MQEKSKKSVRNYRIGVSFVILFVVSVITLYIGFPGINTIYYEGTFEVAATSIPPKILERVATRVPIPTAVKGIYMTSCVASTPSLRSNLVKLINETELNSVMIDIKTYDGYISFSTKNEELKVAEGGCFVKDMQDFIDTLHEHDIYVIGRIASFQDALKVKLHPELAVKKASATTTVWRDHKGIPWIDADAKPHWEYLVTLAKESYNIGFDEINFDYIRFPSDGNMKDIYFPWTGKKSKTDVMRSFYEYLHENLNPLGITISADLFGMTTTNTDDLNIGQILEDALANFDYILPMVYPSHYPSGFLGFNDPNNHVYEIVNYSMKKAVERAVSTTTIVVLPNARIASTTPTLYSKPSFDKNKLRPWLQDNNYPVPYTAEMVRAQIQATYDTGLTSWMLWNAGNRYTKSALIPEE